MTLDRAALVDSILTIRTGDRPERLVEGVAEVLDSAGVHVWRVSSALHVFHPEILGTQLIWIRGTGAHMVTRHHALLGQSIWKDSPVERVITGGQDELRVRLDGSAPLLSGLDELAALGATDYAVFGLDASESITASADPYWRRHFIAFTSNDPRGFSDADLDVFRSIRSVFAVRLALEATRFSANAMLRSYLGANAARRIVSGGWLRGTGEPMRAVIWFCDMRGFTTFSDTRPPREVVATLDAYFDAVASPVDKHGGEVLKFIGDAVLGVFPVGASGAGPACAAAIAAAREACANLGVLNAARATKSEPSLGLGIALHLGDVMYGNIGAQNRLDFTVIGAPVNEVCRVEPLTRSLGVDVLLTAAFVREAGLASAPSLGKHALKGVSEPLEVFGLPPRDHP